MPKIIMIGWRVGMLKISATKLQMAILGLTLKVSKENVDAILRGEQVVLNIERNDIAQTFINEAEKIGVICRVE